LRVVYPGEGATIAAYDSTFIYGSTGTGAASLWINGAQVPVQPNGAFLGFLPIPADGRYQLLASAGADTLHLERLVSLPLQLPRFAPDTAVILPASTTPRGAWTALPGERIEVEFRGTPGGVAALRLPGGERVPLVERPLILPPTEGEVAFTTTGEAEAEQVPGLSSYRGYFAAEPLVAANSSVRRPTLAPLEGGAPERAAILELVVGNDTARAPLPLNLALADPDRPVVAVGNSTPPPAGNGLVIGRPGPGYTYAYFWPNETRLTLTGERNGEYRVQLTPELEAWVASSQVRLLPTGTPPPGGAVGTVRLRPEAGYVDLRITLPERLPFQVNEGERSLELTIFGGVADTDWLLYGPTDPLVRLAEWRQPATGLYQVVLHLERKVWGYQTFWAANGDLVLRVRRPPVIDPDHPLRGLLIAVDAGHPPAGATGPTGLTEAEANLQIALRLQPLLERAGARVFMTRTANFALSLPERTTLATEANADLLVSVHNNALPDGVNPFQNNGTSVYFNHPRAVALARSLQRALLQEFGLRDLGVGRGDLALVRPTWMPSVLTESFFMIIPEQESALRDPAVQERIARAHLRGIEDFLREYAREEERHAPKERR
jgi:N-acetylmuramoyl-L-alanine amidase